MQSCYMKACQPLSAWTDRSVPNFVYLNFLNSLGNISTEGQKNNNNKQICIAP